MPVTNELRTIPYLVRNIADAITKYDELVWYQSTTKDGLYEPVTGSTPTAAVLTSEDTGPFDIDGRALILQVAGVTTYTINFSFASPPDISDVVLAINAVTAAGVTASNSAGTLLLTSVDTGRDAAIEILSDSDAAGYLGMQVGDYSIGLGPNATLVAGTSEYYFTDYHSDLTYWYRTELINTTTAASSGLSIPYSTESLPVIAYTDTTIAYIRLMTLTGRAEVGRRIALGNMQLPNRVGSPEYAVMQQYVECETDTTGYASVRVPRGVVLDFNIVGSGYTRRITVPEDVTSFDLLDPSLVTDDEFGIQSPDIDFAIRTT